MLWRVGGNELPLHAILAQVDWQFLILPPTWFQSSMKHVAFLVGVFYLWLACAFRSWRRDLGGLHIDSWRCGRGSSPIGFPPTIHVYGLCDFSPSSLRAAADCDGSQPIGVGVSGRKEMGLCGRRRPSAKLDRRQSLGRVQQRGGDEGCSSPSYVDRKEVKVWTHTGSTRRRRVHMPWGRHEDSLVQSVCGKDGRATIRPGKPHTGADVGVGKKSADVDASSLHRLRNMDTVLQKSVEGNKIPDLHDAGGRHVHFEDGGRTEQLSSVAGVLQSDANRIHHAGPVAFKPVAAVGKSHGEVDSQIPKLLASFGGGREQGEGGAYGKDIGRGEVVNRQRGAHSLWLEGIRSVASGMEEGPGRCRVLAGTSPCPSPGLASSWGSWGTTHTSGRSGKGGTQRWPSSFTSRSPEGGCGGHRWSKVLTKQGEERSEEEKVEGRERRTSTVEDSERCKRWRRRKRKWQTLKLNGGGVLRLEQREWRVWRTPTRRRVQRKEETVAQMYSVQITWPPFERLSLEEVKAVLIVIYTKVMGDGRGAASSSSKRGVGGEEKETKEKKPRMGQETCPEDEEIKGEEIEINGELKSEKDYISDRLFKFIHHFSGETDHLSKAMKEEAKVRNMKVVCISVDRSSGGDLTTTQPYTSHLESIRQGDVDGYHSGFPCSSYSRLRWRPAPNLPGPVRSRQYPYGLPENDEMRQQECDQGTIMMCRSIEACKAMAETNDNFTAVGFYTMENPPPSNVGDGPHIAAWEMPEMTKFVGSRSEFRKAFFHTCRYQQSVPAGLRIKKPQMFGGNLNGLGTLGKMCNCGDAAHVEVVGKTKSRKSGEYPPELCKAYAKLALDHFEKMGKAEFWDAKEKIMAKHLRKLREKAENYDKEAERAKERLREQKGEEPTTPKTRLRPASPEGAPKKKRKAEREKEKSDEERTTTKEAVQSSSFGWTPGEGKHGAVRMSQAKANHPRNIAFFGGMRHPAKAVEQLPTVQALGLRMSAAWDKFVRLHSRVLETAETYGTKEVKVHEDLVDRWREELRKLWGTKPAPSIRLSEPGKYQTPVDFRLLRSWQERSGDPETEVPDWLEHGCPLGIEKKIKVCNVFPQLPEEEAKVGGEADMAAELERKGFKNYASMEDNKQDAEIEITRYEKEGYVSRLSKEEGQKKYAGGTISRLGLVLKEKENGEKKRRVVIDLRRSGGNSKSSLPEKLVLPRPVDVMRMLKEMNERWMGRKAEEGVEFAVVDVMDAFTVLPLHQEELRHALAPSTEQGQLLLFKALLFGYRTAPLLYSRFAAMIARLLQSGMDSKKAAHQVYLDDSLWVLMGTLTERSSSLSMVLYTMMALKIKVALHKGERAAHVTWVGVRFSLPDRDSLVVGLPEKFLEETKAVLVGWHGRGMASLKELRSLAGKAAWLSNILPRARWVTSVLYAVLKSTEAEEDNVKADGRIKKGLFAVSRLESARRWLVAFLDAAMARPMRKISISNRNQMEVKLCCDASPEGLGSVLVINGTPVAALASPVDDYDVELLGIEKGASSSQGVLEALCLLVALRHWKKRFAGHVLTLDAQSDSMVALALSQRLAASTPTLNWWGAEMSISLEEAGVEIFRSVHIPGKANIEADYLSRPSLWPKVSLPKPLEPLAAAIEVPAVRDGDYYHIPGPTVDSSLWGAAATSTGSCGTWDSVI